MKTVIFDLDGTLADTSGDLIAAANACFRAMGHGDVLDPETDGAIAVRGSRAMLSAGLTRLGQTDFDAQVAEWFPHLIRFYGEKINVHTVLYDGAMKAVADLKRAGYVVGICTNKPEDLAESLLMELGIRGEFGSLIGADTLPVRKPDADPLRQAVIQAGGDPAQSLIVGDTTTDRETARALGVPCILVTFSPDGDGVKALNPEGLVDHFDDLLDEVTRLLGPAD